MDSQLITLLLSVGGTLSAAIVALWKLVHNNYKSETDKREKLETKVESLNEENTELKVKFAQIDSKVDGYLEAKEDLKTLSKAVLTKIHGENSD